MAVSRVASAPASGMRDGHTRLFNSTTIAIFYIREIFSSFYGSRKSSLRKSSKLLTVDYFSDGNSAIVVHVADQICHTGCHIAKNTE